MSITNGNGHYPKPRNVLGGACVTEELWPGHRVSRASYVVSMLVPKIVCELRLRATGGAGLFYCFAAD